MKTNIRNLVPLMPGTCEWCGNICELEDAACCLSCEAQLARLESNQGRMVIRALKKWRMAPNHAARNQMMADITPMIDKFLRIDRERREDMGRRRRAAAQEAAAKASEVPKGPKMESAAPRLSQEDSEGGAE